MANAVRHSSPGRDSAQPLHGSRATKSAWAGPSWRTELQAYCHVPCESRTCRQGGGRPSNKASTGQGQALKRGPLCLPPDVASSSFSLLQKRRLNDIRTRNRCMLPAKSHVRQLLWISLLYGNSQQTSGHVKHSGSLVSRHAGRSGTC